jgi:hypothetical protein
VILFQTPFAWDTFTERAEEVGNPPFGGNEENPQGGFALNREMFTDLRVTQNGVICELTNTYKQLF